MLILNLLENRMSREESIPASPASQCIIAAHLHTSNTAVIHHLWNWKDGEEMDLNVDGIDETRKRIAIMRRIEVTWKAGNSVLSSLYTTSA